MRSIVEADLEIPSPYWYENPINFPNSGVGEEIVVFDASKVATKPTSISITEDAFQQQIADLLNERDPSAPEDPYSSQLIGHKYDMFGRPLVPQT